MPTSTNCMIGAIEEWTYQTSKAQLGVGDTLVMYTDGVNEAFDSNFQEYGDERMQQLLEQQKGQDCRTIIEAQMNDVKSFAGNAPQSDDITIMALKHKA